MEISLVRQRVLETMDYAKKSAAERRIRTDQAGREYDVFLDRVAIPLFRQVANVLRAEGYQFTVFTPGGSVRLTSDRAAEDYVEIALDTAGDQPRVIGHSSRARGRRVIESERPIAERTPAELTEEDVIAFVLKELEPFVER
jgi:NADPH:quinone reductase-like Zn-dependent oxidoreductase